MLFVALSKYTLSCSSIYLSHNHCHFIYHVFERLGFIPDLKNPSVFELSILSGFAGCIWSNSVRAGHIPIDVLTLLNVIHVSDYTADDTALRIVLNCL